MQLRINLDGETRDVLVERVEEPELPRELVTVITAAVTAVLEGRPFRIRHIHPGTGSTAWSQAGRSQIQTSHNVERKSR